MESFRPIVDRLVIQLLLSHYRIDDFVITENGCRIKDKRRAIFLNAWERLLTKPLQKTESRTYRTLFHKQVSEWVHYLDAQTTSPQWWLMHKRY